MKAAYIEAPGPPELIQYGELPTPEPKTTEVRVRIAASAVNPIDTYIRSGLVAANLPKPFIPGGDFAGVVDQVGGSVTRFKAGDRVWGSNQGMAGRQGTLAEYCCVDEQWVYPTPPDVPDVDAAAVALVGITAHLGLFNRTNLTAGETVFVNGGTGGVGSMVVQMAKAVGAKVITTVGSAEKAELARSFGADVVINYKTDDIPAVVKQATGGRGVEVLFETQPPSDFDKTIDLMAPRGRLVVMAGRAARPVFPNGPFYVKCLTMIGFAMFNFTADEQRRCADQINEWLAAGKLRASVGMTFPLSQAVAAHRLQEENTLKKAGTLSGKIIVTPHA
ncbi:quinone oxidoreductase family protein [Limnoglobus roseus]|uniref:NADPH:quinone reductase n=1 Tax=Limnoglobus roseus TaxID=2598579 RepID=A0A5C1A9Z7_9BACT|nr:NADPH:quinone reductase [Limnoglobus roseus]QEL16209.1 NADPH:quinone reductase [Limnoglobus roseus]